MAAKILDKIGVQRYELVRDRIAVILKEELVNQSALHSNPLLNAGVWSSRFISFDREEIPAVNINLLDGTYIDKTQLHRQGDYTYTIDVYTSAIGQDGDKNSVNLGQRIAGIIASILSHPHYKTLDFRPPFLSRTSVESIKRYDTGNENPNIENIAFHRIEFKVVMPEHVGPQSHVELISNDTTVLIDITDKGYQYLIAPLPDEEEDDDDETEP